MIAMALQAVAFQSPPQNLAAITPPIEKVLKLKIEPVIPGKPCINDDTYCDVYAGHIQIQTLGKGVVNLMTTSQEPHSRYRLACAAAFAGLSGSAQAFAEEIMAEAFNSAASQGAFKADVAGVEVSVRPALSSDLLACRFFRY